jgi:hypothetical protein
MPIFASSDARTTTWRRDVLVRCERRSSVVLLAFCAIMEAMSCCRAEADVQTVETVESQHTELLQPERVHMQVM